MKATNSSHSLPRRMHLYLHDKAGCFSQKKSLDKYSKDYFLQKSKSKKQTAWLLLGGGTAAVIGGAIGFANTFEINLWSNDNNKDNGNGFFGVLFRAGVVSDLASIPFL